MTERIGILGGSGLYDFEGFEQTESVKVDTPFGEPSDEYAVGTLGGREVVFLPRHGRGHRFLPHEVNARANIFGFKTLGVGRIISVSAVGSMKIEVAPGDIVFPDQFIDRTRSRPSTFFGGGIAAHVGFADPVCPVVRDHMAAAAERTGVKHIKRHNSAYVCIDGPQFSTRAESLTYRSWDVDVVGMTNLPEARLAREAEICYATIALATDYDCWHESEEDVTVEAVVAVLRQNIKNARKIIAEVIPALPTGPRTCKCATALTNAIMTKVELIPGTVRRELSPILDRVLGS